MIKEREEAREHLALLANGDREVGAISGDELSAVVVRVGRVDALYVSQQNHKIGIHLERETNEKQGACRAENYRKSEYFSTNEGGE